MDFESNSEPPEETMDAESPEDEPRMYELESGINVAVSVEEFTPVNGIEEDEDAPSHGVLLFPGWGMTASDKGIGTLAQEYSESTEGRTFSISTRAEEAVGGEEEDIDMLYEEAAAVAKFIEESGLEEVTLTGHSQGGDKAINLVTILQEKYPDINVKGLVLMGSVGLYEQESLAKDFTKESMIDTPQTLIGEAFNKFEKFEKDDSFVDKSKKVYRNAASIPKALKPGIDIMMSVIQNIGKEVGRSKLDYFDRFNREVSEMSKINPRLQEIEAPVVLISGTNDLVSNPETIMPKEEEVRLAEELETESICDIREHYLQENVFKKSPYVRMLAPSKAGHHVLPLLRALSMAKVSNGLIERFHDGKHIKSEENESEEEAPPSKVVDIRNAA